MANNRLLHFMAQLPPRGGLKRLVKAGYVTDHAVSMDAVLYVITDLGRQALAKAKGRAGGG